MSDVRTNGSRNDPDDIQARLEALRADLKALQSDMRGLANGVGDAASERVTEMLKSAEEMADQLAEQAGVWTADNMESLRESVREQPLLACAMAMGAGVFLGVLLRR